MYLVTGRTESGDEVGAVFLDKPTRDQIDAHFYANGWDEEYRYVGWINWSVIEVELQDPDLISEEAIAAMKEAVRLSKEE